VFLPKYLENHYGIPQYNVHLYMAGFGIVGFALGTVSGSVFMKVFKMEGRRAAGFVLFVSVINLLVILSLPPPSSSSPSRPSTARSDSVVIP
jgi:predicted MFS family arabinose efflux permease